MKTYLAHIAGDGRRQTVEEHLLGTAERSERFAASFGEAERGKLLGLAHDIGKYTDGFQRRLEGGTKVDHATAGALECEKIGERLLSCCIVGHHGGMPDFGNRNDYAGAPTCIGRLKQGASGGILPHHWDGQLPRPPKMPPIQDSYGLSMWTRMLFSCLVDADYLDTEAFMSDGEIVRDGYDSLPVLLERLMAYIEPWQNPTTQLNRNRCAILNQCLASASKPRGLYALTVPTGGGKTVSSLAFALKHGVEHHMERVIYVIPYTSIIEQNAAVFREILGANNVVEHHSGVNYDEEEETNTDNCFQRLAAENWDAPVIVTTAVQFFESLYSNRPSKCRKLHNIANSVIIFDEAQMLPSCHLLPCVGAMSGLVSQFRSTVVLCTATQPALLDLFQHFSPGQKIEEICPDISSSFQNFRRVCYRDGGTLSNGELAECLGRENQVLCIVNTRKAAQDIFALLPEEGRFHLSTLLYPAHRKAVLETIRQRLREGLACRVVSTSLIEAGVDVDFPAVYRELSGLDSVAQAAGRCNREGKREAQDSVVTYFIGETPALKLQKVNIQAAGEALEKGGDPGDPATMGNYFAALRSLITQTDKENVVKAMREGIAGCLLPFKTVAERFRLIDNATCTVYIPLGAGEALCRKIADGYADKNVYRQAGQFSVNIYANHYDALNRAGMLHPLTQDSAVLLEPRCYDAEMGLTMKVDAGMEYFV